MKGSTSSVGIKERAWRCRITTMGGARVEGLEGWIAPEGREGGELPV